MFDWQPKSLPILFSGPMVRAILEGRKTQTRRVLSFSNSTVDGSNPNRNPAAWNCWDRLEFNGAEFKGGFQPTYVDGEPHFGEYLHVPIKHENPSDESVHRVRCKWEPEMRLWVRETWSLAGNGPFYKADSTEEQRAGVKYAWKPSIHMPRWASRITLEISSIRVERLQEISEEDAEAEGVYGPESGLICSEGCGWRGREDVQPELKRWEKDGDWGHLCPECSERVWHHALDEHFRQGYQDLWDSINARKHPWASNPWVWRIEFPKFKAEGADNAIKI